MRRRDRAISNGGGKWPVAFLAAFSALAQLPAAAQQPSLVGVNIRPVEHPDSLALGVRSREGAVIVQVFPGSPAEAAGLKAGDVVVKCGGSPVATCDDLLALLRGGTAGDRRRFEFFRGGNYYYADLVLGRWSTPGGAATGVAPPPAAPADSAGAGAAGAAGKSDENRAYLGMRATSAGRPDAVAAGVESPTGAVVLRVTPDASAALAGLQRGDLIVEFGDFEIQCVEDLETAARRSGPGSRPRVILVRASSRLQTTLVVGSQPVNYSLLPFNHAGGGYGLKMLEGWTIQSPDQPGKLPEMQYDAIESCEGNYRLVCFRSSWPAPDGPAALAEFVAKRRAEQPQAEAAQFQLAGAPAVRIGYHAPEERRVIWRISWVDAGRRYVVNASGPPLADPSRLPPPVVDLLATMELPSAKPQPGAETLAGDQSPGRPQPPPVKEPSAPPEGWVIHHSGSVRLHLPPEWKPSPFSAADEGRWLVGETVGPEASLAVVRDVELASLLKGMTVLGQRDATLGTLPAEQVQVEVEESHRKTRGLLAAAKKPDPGGSMIVVAAYCCAEKWSQYEPVFQKVFQMLRIVADGQ
jgi:hypothetical protein